MALIAWLIFLVREMQGMRNGKTPREIIQLELSFKGTNSVTKLKGCRRKSWLLGLLAWLSVLGGTGSHLAVGPKYVHKMAPW